MLSGKPFFDSSFSVKILSVCGKMLLCLCIVRLSELYYFVQKLFVMLHLFTLSCLFSFRLADTLTMTMCHNLGLAQCDNNTLVNPTRVNAHTWTMPVGYYGNSLYLIRVADNSLVSSRTVTCDVTFIFKNLSVKKRPKYKQM